MDFSGTGVAIVTPFDKKGSVDFNAIEKILKHVIDGQVDFLVLLGTTAETPVLTKQEKKDILDFVLEKTKHSKPIVVGCGGNNTSAIIEEMQYLEVNRFDAVLSVAPYYNKPTQKGLYLHFKTIADNSPVPVILYNVPSRTSSNLEASTTLQLADHQNIAGIKEAGGNLDQITAIIQNRPDGFKVFSGDDSLALPIQSIGGDGLISVAANALPFLISSMIKHTFEDNYDKARQIHLILADFVRMLFCEGNPAGIKAALEAMHLANAHVRLPLVEASDDLKKRISQELIKINEKITTYPV